MTKGNYTHPYVDIPITDDITFEGLQKYCSHYNCYATKLNDTHYRISTAVAANLFWAGINFNASSPSPLMITPADMYLRSDKHKNKTHGH